MEYKGTFKTIDAGLRFINDKLEAIKTDAKEASLSAILSNHALKHLSDASNGIPSFTITIRKTLLFKDIIIEASGIPIDLDNEGEKENIYTDLDAYVMEEMANADPSAKSFHKSFRDFIQYKHVKGVNRITIPIEESETKDLTITFGSLILGIIVGLVFRLCFSSETCEAIDYYSFDLIKSLFLNALKIIVGPLVFFSLASCVSKFRNLKDLGRISVKTILLYLFTTIVAITFGFLLYKAFPVGQPGILESVSANAQNISESEANESEEEFDEVVETLGDSDFSMRNLILGVVPDNALSPFIHISLLQIIFLALLVGIAISKSGEHGVRLMTFVDSFNHLLIVTTSLIIKFVPIIIFCAMAELVMTAGTTMLLTLLSYSGLVVGGMLLMIAFYCILIFATTKLNPFVFLKKFAKAMMMGFVSSSAAASMPVSISCLKKMGVDNKVSSFTIPLGANINMDGSSMVFTLTVMFMANIYGIDLNGGLLISTFISIIFLALGSPTMAGADLVIIAVLFSQVGIPLEAIGIILGIDAIFDMVQAISNTTGDAAVTLIVAKSEHLLDVEQYRS